MTRLLAIPVTGTVAALIVILLAHGPRADATVEPEPSPPPVDTLPDTTPAPLDEEEEPEPPPPPPPPPPEPREFQMQVDAEGGFEDLATGQKFENAEAVIKELGDARHKIVVANAAGVTEAQLEAAVAALREQFEMRKIYRAPEK